MAATCRSTATENWYPALDYLLGGALNGWNLRPGDHGVKSILEAGSKTGMGIRTSGSAICRNVDYRSTIRSWLAASNTRLPTCSRKPSGIFDPGMEATWTLMAVSTYLPLDARWVAQRRFRVDHRSHR